MEIRMELAKTKKPKPDVTKVSFGTYFTDNMFIMDYTKGVGWHDARIVPYAPIVLDPSSVLLHYGMSVFEGLKAYRRVDGGVQLFRPTENIKRLNRSAERLCLPQLDEEFALQALVKFVDVERDWVPTVPDTSLYLRPFIIATDADLALHDCRHFMYIVIACPVNSYYPEGLSPVKILIEDQDVRAVRGGTGYAKCGGNYAASMRAGVRAAEKGYSQVLWLDGVERKYIEEVGAMNVMFKVNGEIITPQLGDSVLAGITRKSCIELIRSWGMEVSERLFSVDELLDAIKTGKLEEAWQTGTAAVISPIGDLCIGGKPYVVSGGKIGEFTQKLYDTLTGIQWGKIPDPFGWTMPV